MIGELLNQVSEALQAWLDAQSLGGNKVSLKRVAQANLGPDLDEDAINIVLLNVEEELTRRDQAIHQQRGSAGLVAQKAPLYFYLQVLFISNYPNDPKTELNKVYSVMTYFQENRQLTFEIVYPSGDPPQSVTVIFELNTLPLSDLHYIWENLGMQQQPAVAYRIRTLTIDTLMPDSATEIQSIEVTQNGKKVW